MGNNRVFDENELREMERSTLDCIIEAIDAEDKDRAKYLSKRLYQESLTIHDSYVHVFTGALNYIYNTYGSESLEAGLRDIFTRIIALWNENPPKTDLRSRVEGLVHTLRGHLQPLKIEEDDEKFTITMQPCGSGQRLLESGAYGKPCSYTILQEPQPITFGKSDCPIYCTHDPMLEILSIEMAGYPGVVAYPTDKMATGPCKFCIYKDPKDIPKEIFERVGKKKPETT